MQPQKNLNSPSQPRDQDFEKSIAYMFGIKDATVIQAGYSAALKAMDDHPHASDKLPSVMMPHFKKYYRSISEKLAIDFDTECAAQFEFELLIAHQQFAPLEQIVGIMNGLYACVLGGVPADYQLPSSKRAELFIMKTTIQRDIGIMSEAQKKYMQSLHQESEYILNQHVARRQKELQESMF